jgi:hypothetical protein
MTARPYQLASERSDLAFGNLRDGITGESHSIWRLAPTADAMLGQLFVFVAGPHHPRTDDLDIVKVVSGPRYLRGQEEPYYQIVSRLRDGSFERAGAHACATELWPLGGEVEVNVS